MHRELLKKSMEFVPTYGWSARSIREAARALNLPSAAAGHFNVLELIAHYSQSLDEKAIVKSTKLLTQEQEFFEKAQVLLKVRLESLTAQEGLWNGALEILMKPQNLMFGLNNVAQSADRICHAAGDRSFDSMWYTRRTAVSAIISTSDLYFAVDSSRDKGASFKFIERHIKRAKLLEPTMEQGEAYLNAALSSMRRML